MEEVDAISALLLMGGGLSSRRSGQFEFYYPTVPSPPPIKVRTTNPIRNNWTPRLHGRTRDIRMRCGMTEYGNDQLGLIVVIAEWDGVKYTITLDDRGDKCTITNGLTTYNVHTTYTQQARRVIVNEGEPPRMKRIREYTIDATQNTPKLVIQIRPLAPAVWYVRNSII